jgi:hypothetical protein
LGSWEGLEAREFVSSLVGKLKERKGENRGNDETALEGVDLQKKKPANGNWMLTYQLSTMNYQL